MLLSKVKNINPWAWIPTLYFAEGLPYIVVNTISVILFKKMGMSNTELAYLTGWLYLPWVIKPFWSPFVDIIKTKRWWIILTQLIIAIALAAVAFLIPVHNYVRYVLIGFWIIGFSSATHDIAADGFYMLALDHSRQSFFVGIRSTFYRLATIFGQGILVIVAGALETRLGDIPRAWSITFLMISVFFLLITLYHRWILPRPSLDKSSYELMSSDASQLSSSKMSGKSILRGFINTFVSFFEKKDVFIAVLFMLLFRLPEAQLVKIIQPFLLDSQEVGGLGLSTMQVGFVYGTIGIIGLTLGGILGGILVSRDGLKKWLWPMALSLTLPCVVFCYLSMAQPDMSNIISMVVINACVFIEQFGYGFGFTAFMLYLIYFAEGPSKTSHYAICTAFMALGMMLPGMAAGWIQDHIGYVGFFWWVMLCCIATLIVTALIKVDAIYGKKEKI